MTTPRQFYTAIGEADIEAGMLGRFLVVNSEAECSVRRRGRASATPPPGVVRWCQNMRQAGGGVLSGVEVHDVAPPTIELNFTDEAWGALDDFQGQLVKRRRALASSGLDVLLARAAEISMRIAAIVSCSKATPTIDAESMGWAIAYTQHAFNGLLEAVKSRITGSEFGARRQEMLEAITLSAARGLTERELTRRFRSLKPREHAEAVRALVDAGEVALVEIKTKGRTRVAYVAVEVELE